MPSTYFRTLSYVFLRNHQPHRRKKRFFKLLEQVVEHHQVFIVNRRDGENVALIAESDLRHF